MPTTGPFTSTWSPNSGKDDYRYSRWFCNVKQYRAPTEYTLDKSWTLSRTPSTGISDPCYSVPVTVDDERSRALNTAYERLRKSLGESASLGVALAERRKAVSMIAERSLQLYQFTRAVRKMRFGEAASILGLNKVPSGVRKSSKDFANNYLEFHFGWAPLVTDIGNAVEVLQQPFTPVLCIGRGQASSKLRFTEFNEPSWQGSYYWYRDKATTKCRMSAQVKVTNPNLWLANQLGFVNPALIAYELIPFSFVVGWFTNVETFLSQFNDFLGLGLSYPTTTYLSEGVRSSAYPNYGWGWSARRISMTRVLRLDKPGLQIKPFVGFSVRRGLAAVSLLVQSLKG
jgi:hypothetical protein